MVFAFLILAHFTLYNNLNVHPHLYYFVIYLLFTTTITIKGCFHCFTCTYQFSEDAYKVHNIMIPFKRWGDWKSVKEPNGWRPGAWESDRWMGDCPNSVDGCAFSCMPVVEWRRRFGLSYQLCSADDLWATTEVIRFSGHLIYYQKR